MGLLLVGTGLLSAATLLLALLLRAVLWLRGRRPRRFWRRVLVVHIGLAVLHLLVTMPLTLGFLGSRLVGTRGDERAYRGPIVGADSIWHLQSRESLAAEPPGDERCAVHFAAADGVPLRAFHVLPPTEPPRCAAVLVHGLFRGGLELEPVAAMLHGLGAEVLMLELRNHGGSGRARPTFGRDEALDVEAAVHWLRGRPRSAAAAPLVLFGVSLGTVAVSLAVPHLDDLAGVVLDAPVDDLRATAHRMLSVESRRMSAMPQPFRSLVLGALAFWCGFDWDRVQPRPAILQIDPAAAVLLIGGGDDRRVPPATVEALFDALPTPPARKRLWILPPAGHGQVWLEDPDGYRERLEWLIEAVEHR